MISQLQNIRAFVSTHLTDVVDWGRHVTVDQGSSSDNASILIATPFNRYRISAASAYIEPPMGAPVQCRSLGTIQFHDLAESKRIVGPRADATWTDIAKHVHVRELTDAIAAAKREAAEAAPQAIAAAHAKLTVLVERGKKWGVGALIDVGHQSTLAPPTSHVAVLPAEEPQAGDGPHPFVGAPVIFVTNPGEQIGGMQEIPGWCVKVLAGGHISMFVMPDHSEPSYRDNLPRRSQVHKFNCWDFNSAYLRDQSRIRHLEEAIEKIADEANRDREALDALEARVPLLATQAPRHTETLSLKKKP